MAAPDPLAKTFETRNGIGVSKKAFTVAGILTNVYGIDEITPQASSVSCLWLLHPRLATQERMEPLAVQMITEWTNRIKQDESKSSPGLIVVTFDQRNHGSRLIDKLANEAWRSGNPRHAQDMFSIYHGTAQDTSLLITYLPAYVFPNNEITISSHMVLGVSLGGHAAWHCALHDPRITTIVVVIGCADYTQLMTDRARKSKLQTWTSSNPPGSTFMGSRDFPIALIEAVKDWDPAGLLLTGLNGQPRTPSTEEQEKLKPLMQKLQGKRILNLSGGADKLVPYSISEPFLTWFKAAISPDGWSADANIYLKDLITEGVGHAMSPSMAEEAVKFVVESLSDGNRTKASKI